MQCMYFAAQVTIYISSSVIRPIQFLPPLPANNQTAVVTISEQQRIGYIVPYQVTAYSDNQQAVFLYQKLQGSDPGNYLTLDENSGGIIESAMKFYHVI